MEVIALLRSKNRCLEQFLDQSKEFNVRSRQDESLKDLSAFQDRRDSLLNAISLFDSKISEIAAKITSESRTPLLVEQVRKELDRKEALVQAILKEDLEIITRIEEEKNRVMQEMSSSRSTQTRLSRFKSTWMPPAGEEFDGTL